MNPTHTRTVAIFAIAVVAGLLGCGKTEESASVQAKVQQLEGKAAARTDADKRGHDAHNEKKGEEGHGEHEAGEALKLTQDEIRTAGIQVAELAEREVSEEIQLTGTIHANQDKLAHISPRITGRVVKVHASLGDTLKAGQTLAVLDSIELGEAQSAFAQAQSEVNLARTNFNRIEQLHSEEIVPQKDLHEARAVLQKAEAALHAVRDKLKMLGVPAGHGSHEQPGSVFALTAPFAGTVIEKDAVLGELAQPDKSLFTIADLSVLWIEANLFEKDLGKVNVGGEAVVTLAAYPKQTFSGQLTYIGSMLDKDTRTLKARVEVPNPDGKLKPEMFATVGIRTAGQTKVLSVPENAVVLIQGQPTVFIEDSDGFEPRTVELGDKLRGQVALKNGIAAGNLVVVSGAYALKARMLKSQMGEGHAH